jgi:hypothetical protein
MISAFDVNHESTIDSSPGGDPSSYRRMEATLGERNPPAFAFACHQFERPS